MDLVDLSGNNPIIKLLSTPNRTNAGSPVSSLVPEFPGELIEDTTNMLLWRACGTANTDWMPIRALNPGSSTPVTPPSLDSTERWIRATQGMGEGILLPGSDSTLRRNGRMTVYRPDQA